jgi:hypothetical protein
VLLTKHVLHNQNISEGSQLHFFQRFPNMKAALLCLDATSTVSKSIINSVARDKANYSCKLELEVAESDLIREICSICSGLNLIRFDFLKKSN